MDDALHFSQWTPRSCRGSSSLCSGTSTARVLQTPLLGSGVPPHQKRMNLAKIISFAKTFLGCSALTGPRSGGVTWGRFKRRPQVNHCPGNANKMRLFSRKTGKKKKEKGYFFVKDLAAFLYVPLFVLSQDASSLPAWGMPAKSPTYKNLF